MSSIKEVEISRRDDVSSLMGEFFQTWSEKNRPGREMIDQLLSFWSEGKIKILGNIDEDDQIRGIVQLGMVTNRLVFVHIRDSEPEMDEIQKHKLERELFDAGFEHLKGYESWVTSGGSRWLSRNLMEYALKLGFIQYERIGIEVGRDELKKLQVPPIPPEYTLENFDDKWKETIARLLYESFKGSLDMNAEPDSVGTEEKCLNMVNDTIANRWGDFKNGRHSWVLKHGDEIVGVSSFTIMDDTMGFGVWIGILPLYRGKGLGRLLFTHSLKSVLISEPAVIKVGGARIANNPVSHLHESVGFKEISRHTLYTWVKDHN